MALILTLDIGDTIEIEDIKFRYSNRNGRKINISVEAPKTKKIVLNKSEQEKQVAERKPVSNNS